MKDEPGLRERKKDATRQRLMVAAVDMFEKRGFDNVSVAEVAAAAEVSKKTVFNYFDSKEDLVIGFAQMHLRAAAEVVRERPVGTTPHQALLDDLLRSLSERHPATGLSDNPFVWRVQCLVRSTPALNIKWHHYSYVGQHLLAEALIEESSSELTANLIAAQVHSVKRVLAVENIRRIQAGEKPDEIYPDAVAAAEHAFSLLEKGLGNLLTRTESP